MRHSNDGPALPVRHTRTHVRYFTEDQPAIIKLREALAELDKDWEARGEFMSEATYRAGRTRLDIVQFGATVLTEVVPE